MNFFRKIVFIFGFIFLGFLGITSNSQANEVGFAVEPIFPKNQIDASSGYFHLLMPQGEKQIIQVKLKNSKDKQVVLNTWATSATTNVNGVVDYSDRKSEVDSSLVYNLKELVKVKEKIELAPNSEEIVDIEINMPDASLEGVLAGGLTFEEERESNAQNVSSQTGIKNKFSYVIAVILQQEAEILLDPEIKLEEVKPTQLNGKNAISAQIKNVTSAFLNQMSIDVSIRDKKTEKVVFASFKEALQMAPNSVMNSPVFLNGEKLEAGDYIYEAKIKGEGSNDEERELAWNLVSEFTIEKDEAKALNKTDTQIAENNHINWLVVGLIIGNMLLLILIICFVIYYVKKKQISTKKRKRKKKKH